MFKVVFYSANSGLIVAEYIGIGYEDISCLNPKGVHIQMFEIKDRDGSTIKYCPSNVYINKVEIQKIL